MKLYSLIAIQALAIACTGCASTAPAQGSIASEIQVSSDAPGRSYMVRRKIAYAGQATLLYVKSSQIEPVLRPVSYFLSGASLLFKSAGGALSRLAINTSLLPALDGDIPEVRNAEPMDLVAWETELDRVTGTKQSLGTIGFLVDGEEYFGRLEAAIVDANESIDIRTYIFDNDDYAVTVADMLKARSKSDVRVRVLLDTLGNMQAMQADPESLPAAHRAPLSMSMYLEENSGVTVRNIANPFFTGDHTKTTIIDKEVAFVGGMNIGREYRYAFCRRRTLIPTSTNHRSRRFAPRSATS